MNQASGQASFAQIQISSSNNLLLFVSQVFKFFFDMKLSLDQLDEQQASPTATHKVLPGGGANQGKVGGEQEDEDMNNDDDDQYSDEDEEDLYFRRQAHLSCLLGQLKREKQSKNWSQSQGGPGTQSKSPMLKFFMNNCCLDISLFSDIISIISFLMHDRPLKHGELTLKDIKTIQTFNEVLIEYFVSNQSPIQDHVTSSPGHLLIKRLKEANRTSPFAQDFSSKDYQIS